MGSGVDLKLVEGPSHDQAPRAEEKGNHAKDGWEQTPKQALSIPRHRMGDRFAILTTVRIARAEAIVGECMFANFASPRSITVTHVRSRRTKRRAQDKSRAKGLTTDNRRSTNSGLTWETWHDGGKDSPTVHVLYLFAGVERRADVRHFLEELAKRDGYTLGFTAGHPSQ